MWLGGAATPGTTARATAPGTAHKHKAMRRSQKPKTNFVFAALSLRKKANIFRRQKAMMKIKAPNVARHDEPQGRLLSAQLYSESCPDDLFTCSFRMRTAGGRCLMLDGGINKRLGRNCNPERLALNGAALKAAVSSRQVTVVF